MITLKIKRLSPEAVLPAKYNPAAAGIDIYTNESYILRPGEVHAFTTGITAEFPEGYAALIWDRSGLGSKGIHRLAGVIDSDYRGEWKIVLVNLSGAPYEVRAGDKIAQCVLQRFELAEIVEVARVAGTARGAAGFGSSGR